MTLDQLTRLLRPLSLRISNLVGRGVVRVADDAKKVQELQIDLLSGETRDEVERFQEYGLTSVPEDGAECLVVCVGGVRDQVYCVGTTDRRYRIGNLSSGEVALYSKWGQTIVLKQSGDIELTPKPGSLVTLAGATNPVSKGDSLNTAIGNLGTTIATALTTMGAAAAAPMVGALAVTAGTSITAGVVAFNAAAAAALSTKVKLS